ncbi:CHAT domain-containing protein [Crassisporium funariophilum]|nr:CHAT domain-containing protein [Crassisporium funariophilum]
MTPGGRSGDIMHLSEPVVGTGDVTEVEDILCINRSISAQQTVIKQMSDEDDNLPVLLDGLGTSLRGRFERTRDLSDINEAISAYQRAIYISPDDDDDAKLAHLFNNLALSFQRRFESTGDIRDLHEAVSAQEEAVDLTSGVSYTLAIELLLNNLGNTLEIHFHQTGDISAIDEALAGLTFRGYVDLKPDLKGHVHLPPYLKNLENILPTRFGRKKEAETTITSGSDNIRDSPAPVSSMSDFVPPPRAEGFIASGEVDVQDLPSGDDKLVSLINHSISTQPKSIRLSVKDDANLHAPFVDVGTSLGKRFDWTGDLSGLNEAVSSQQTAIYLARNNSAEMARQLNELALLLQNRFENAGDIRDLNEAILAQEEAINLTLEDDAVTLGRLLTNLGNSLETRFDRTGVLSDINRAILLQRRSISLTPEGHLPLPGRLNNLANCLAHRFERLGDLTDINQSISALKRAVELTPSGHDDLHRWLNNLGASLESRFDYTGDLSDYNEAILAHRRAVQITPDGHENLPCYLNNLGISYNGRFQRSGELFDVNEAISAQQRAVNLTLDGNVNLPGYLNSLGHSLRRRFVRVGDLSDINEAIAMQKHAVEITPDGHADMARWLNGLGISLEVRFGRTKNPLDLNEAIAAQRKTIDLTPDGHVDVPLWLNTLGTSLHMRFISTGDLADIDEAIAMQRRSIALTPDGHGEMPGRLHNLASFLGRRYERKKERVDIDEGIAAQQKAVDLTPEGHASMAGRLNSLGHLFYLKRDHKSAVTTYQLAATQVTASPLDRFEAARAWASTRQTFHQPPSLEAYSAAVDSLSQVAGMGQTIQQRHENLINVSKFSTRAAAAAFYAGRLESALELLEHGRSLVWNQLNNLRTPLDDLRLHDPAIADDILRVSEGLEQAGSRAGPASVGGATRTSQNESLQNEVVTHNKLAQEWDQLLAKVRNIPQFKDFLRPAKAADLLQRLPKTGAVVIINADEYRCDALILTADAAPVHVAFEPFTCRQASDLRSRLGAFLSSQGVRTRKAEFEQNSRGMRYASDSHSSVLQDILRELWTGVVKPVLEGLELLRPPSNPVRIWWCATGPLAFLPIHAAGIYGQKKRVYGSVLSDYAISSYTPTLSALLERVNNPRQINQGNNGLLMISQVNTPDLPQIPGTKREVEAIQERLNKGDLKALWLDGSSATVNRVTEEMESHSCVHLACHAIQDIREPLRSGFFLHDRRLELSEIIKKRLPAADLAFLSACQTSTGDEKLSEEAVHLAAGMLAAGYQGVIATMWSIQDKYGPRMAQDIYGQLLGLSVTGEGKGLDSSNAALALHHTARRIRDELGDSEASLLVWVPYVHLGL